MAFLFFIQQKILVYSISRLLSLLYWLEELFFFFYSLFLIFDVLSHCLLPQINFSLWETPTVAEEGQSGETPGVFSQGGCHCPVDARVLPSDLLWLKENWPERKQAEGRTHIYFRGRSLRRLFLKGASPPFFSGVTLSVTVRAGTHLRGKPPASQPKVSEVSRFVSGSLMFSEEV